MKRLLVAAITGIAAIVLCLGCYSQQTIRLSNRGNPESEVVVRGLDATWQVVTQRSILSHVAPIALRGDTLFVWYDSVIVPVAIGDIYFLFRKTPDGGWAIGGAAGAAIGAGIGYATEDGGDGFIFTSQHRKEIAALFGAAIGAGVGLAIGALVGADEKYDLSNLLLQQRREIVRNIVTRYHVPPAPVIGKPK